MDDSTSIAPASPVINPAFSPAPSSPSSPAPAESRARPWLIALLALVVGIGIGVLATKYYPDFSRPGQTPKPLSNPSSAGGAGILKAGPDSIIKRQEAQAVGIITEVKDGFVTIKGEGNQQAGYRLAPSFTIQPSLGISTSSAQPKGKPEDIKIGQKALIDLRIQGEHYVITSITYLPQ